MSRPAANPGGFAVPSWVSALHRFFASWRFALVTIALCLSFDLFQLVMLWAPRSVPGIGAFAEEFRLWCYRSDPATGRPDLAYLCMFLLQPALTGVVVAWLWWQPLGDALRRERRATLPYLGGSALAVFALLFWLVGLGGRANAATLPFPAEALRTHKPAPALSLVDQDGVRVELGSLQGRVVIVTGIYATCYHTCPLIMAELRRALDALGPDERKDVSVVAVTLNPEHDTQEVLKKTAERYQVASPAFRLLGGPPKEVEATLDRLEIARTTDPMSGQIDHANLFIVVDRKGEVAYRLTLGERQEPWLVEALRILCHEAGPRSG